MQAKPRHSSLASQRGTDATTIRVAACLPPVGLAMGLSIGRSTGLLAVMAYGAAAASPLAYGGHI